MFLFYLYPFVFISRPSRCFLSLVSVLQQRRPPEAVASLASISGASVNLFNFSLFSIFSAFHSAFPTGHSPHMGRPQFVKSTGQQCSPSSPASGPPLPKPHPCVSEPGKISFLSLRISSWEFSCFQLPLSLPQVFWGCGLIPTSPRSLSSAVQILILSVIPWLLSFPTLLIAPHPLVQLPFLSLLSLPFQVLLLEWCLFAAYW